MTKSPIFKLLSFALIAWLVPFFVSVFMIDNTKNPIMYKPDYITFKITMLVILVIVTTMGYGIIRWYTKLNWVITAMTFLMFSCVLDVVILINIFRANTTSWVLTVLPVYLLVFFGLSYIVLRRETSTEIVQSATNKAKEIKQSAAKTVNDIIT